MTRSVTSYRNFLAAMGFGKKKKEKYWQNLVDASSAHITVAKQSIF
jgi:hypothetical protein